MTQPDPTPNNRKHVQQRVIEELNDRYVFGVNHYGTGLQVDNGRRMSRDYREELQDALVYATGIEMMDEELIKILNHLRDMHHAHDGMTDVCTICLVNFPCHTRVDVVRALELLGERSGPKES